MTNNPLDEVDHLTCSAFEEDITPTNTLDEVYSSRDMLQDNILDQDFDTTRLSVGDVFFDGNNGDTCDIEDYTLGWVEVVAIHRRSVYLSPIYSPQERPFLPKSLEDLPVRAREDVIDPKYMGSKLPDPVIKMLHGRKCWEWDERLANKAAAVSRLRVRGQIVMSAYNVHGFANGEKQRKHSHRCHKYKDTYRAKWCALGFGRSVFNNTDLRQVISKNKVKDNVVDEEKGDSNSDEGDSVDENIGSCKDSKQTKYDELVVEDLPQPSAPPKSGERDDRVLCLDLRRKCGTHSTELRQNVESTVENILEKQLCDQIVLLSRVHHRVMSFLWNPEDEQNTYADQYLCETSAIMAALLGCNTNVSPLGGNVQAINALFYLTGYLSKNPVKPTSWVTCIIAALKSSFRWKSEAEDTGTASRNAKFFLQKVLNRLNALAETTDTQAVMLLLGFKSFQCSHRFAFCFHRQALETETRLHSQKRNEVDRHQLSSGDEDEDVETMGPGSFRRQVNIF